MPINLNDIITAHPVDVPWLWVGGIAVVFVSSFMSLVVAYMEWRDTSVIAYLFMVLFSAFAGICLTFSINDEARDARASDLSAQIQEHYGLEVPSDAARLLLSTSSPSVEVVHESTLYTVSSLHDGSVVIVDSRGDLLDSKE